MKRGKDDGQMKHIKKSIPWLLVIIWMGLIFCFSHQPASQSSHLSSGISQTLVTILGKIIPAMADEADWMHYIIRKAAHLFVYMVLGFLVSHALANSGVKGWRRFGLAMVICFLYAVSDEVHQVFIPGRSGQIGDVVIDSVGALLALFFNKGICRKMCNKIV